MLIASFALFDFSHGRGGYVRNADYPCQFVFTKPYDPARLTELFYAMAAEARIPKDLVRIEFPDEAAKDFPASNGIYADHYVSGGAQIGPESNWFSNRLAEFNDGTAAIVLRCYNSPAGKPTVWNAILPGGAWDGSSCFNFCKELVHRYYGGEPTDFFMPEKLTLRPEATAKLDSNTHFGQFMLRMPYAVLSNMSDFMWQFYRSQPFLGGPGLLPRMNLLNFDKALSEKVAAGFQARGAKPYAGCVWACAVAFKKVMGYWPHSLIQQSSMQTRAYEPVLKDRNVVGDWLIGPVRNIRSLTEAGRAFSLKDAQRMYEDLMDELGHGTDCGRFDGAIAKACEAKHYGLLNWGAAVFEFFPFYPDENKILDSIFLNNYGIRSIHPDSGFYSYNWAAPTGIALNTMCVNGKWCTALGTATHSQDELDAIRDEVEKILIEVAEAPAAELV